MTDNNKLVQTISLPGMEEIDNSTVSEITALKEVLIRYEALLGRIIRGRVSN
jgi:hypothetical protein